MAKAPQAEPQNAAPPSNDTPPANPPASPAPAAADPTLLAKLGAANSEVEQLRAQLRSVQADHAKTKGELAQAHQSLRDAREENAALRVKLDQGAASALPDLGNGAFELASSVVIPNHEGHRLDARKGDVVTDGDPEALQKHIGTVARVFRVSRETLEDLLEHQHLRV